MNLNPSTKNAIVKTPMRGKTLTWVVAGYAWLTAMVLIGGATYPGYSHFRKFISELGADGAPHGSLVSVLGFLPAGLLLMMFAFAAIRALPVSAANLIGFGLFGFYAFGLFWSAFFPCDYQCRPAHPSINHILHVSIGMLSYLGGVVTAFIIAAGIPSWSGSSSLPLICVAAGVTGLVALRFIDPDFRFAGLAQRWLEASMAVWSISCAVHIDRHVTTSHATRVTNET